MKPASNFEKSMLKKGIVFTHISSTKDEVHSITPVNSDPRLDPINPLFQKSRINKSKRFNSTNSRYKNVASKAERTKASHSHLMKWSQGKGNSTFKNQFFTLNSLIVAMILEMNKCNLEDDIHLESTNKINNKTLRVHTAVRKQRHPYKGGYTSMNDTHPISKLRFVTSSKSKRSGVKPKLMKDMKELSTNSKFSRIYTPQNYMQREKRIKGFRSKQSKNKTMITTEADSKQSVDPIVLSTNKESNMTLNSSSIKNKNRFRVLSANTQYFKRLKSAKKNLNSTDTHNERLSSLSLKDWKIFSVHEGAKNAEAKTIRNCCSAKKTRDRLNHINFTRRLFRHRQEAFENARHIDSSLAESQKAEMKISHLQTKGIGSIGIGNIGIGNIGIDNTFSNSFMNAMFRDTSLEAAERQKETIIREQRKKLDTEMRRRQTLLENEQKASLRMYYKKEHKIKVSQKVVDSLSVPQFEEYLKRRCYEAKARKALLILKKYILGFVYKIRFKKLFKKRSEAAIIIQKWVRNNSRFISCAVKKRRMEAIKVVSAHLKSYQVFMRNKDFLYKLRLKKHFLYFNEMRKDLMVKSQMVIRKNWLRIRELIRKRRREQFIIVRKALRIFTVMIYTKAKKTLEIIQHFRKFRRTPCHRSWSCRSIGKGKGNKDDRNKRTIRKKMKNSTTKKYFKFTEDLKYQKDIYETEKKFKGKHFRRSKSENTLITKCRLDYRNTFLSLPGFKDLLKEVIYYDKIEHSQQYRHLEPDYEYKNLKKISATAVNQRICSRYYKKKYDPVNTIAMPLYGWIYSETVGWTKPVLTSKKKRGKFSQHGNTVFLNYRD